MFSKSLQSLNQECLLLSVFFFFWFFLGFISYILLFNPSGNYFGLKRKVEI